MKFQFSIARLLLATTGFAFVLGIMKPLKMAGNPLVLIAASAVAGIVLIAKRNDLRLKGTIAIFLLLADTPLFIAMRYIQGPWDAPNRLELRNTELLNSVESLLSILMFPLGYIDGEEPILFVLLVVANCYLWAQCICWIIAAFQIPIRVHKILNMNRENPDSEEHPTHE